VLESLRLQNFRGFDDHVVPLREFTVIVGANNAGKSTLVEALRLVALVVGRLLSGTAQFTGVPDWLENHSDAYRGTQPSRRGRRLEGYGTSTFYHYGTPPSMITASFSSGSSVAVFVGPDGEVHGVARDREGRGVGTAAEAKSLDLSPIAIQPQVAPLLRKETILLEETVRRGEGTYLAPQHFRNQLFFFNNGWADFKEMAEANWPGLQIRELRGDHMHPKEPLELDVRDGDFVGEVNLMGHGLQMWLQTIWFLARTPREATVVLDEPDVYMHPDLQRRLLTLVRTRFRQLLIATHSIEIVSDVDVGCILSIDRRQSESSFVSDLPGVQQVIDDLGGVHNIQVARLFRSRTFFLTEGDDVKILRILQSQAAPQAQPIDLVPHGELGGRGGWASGLPARLPPYNAERQKITSYCILDRDYFPDEEVAERYEEARQWGVQLRVWSRKELENFLLVPDAISRFISSRVDPGAASPTTDEVAEEIDRIAESMKDAPITDEIAKVIFDRNRKAGLPSANKEARALVAARWATPDRRWAIAPGKKVISRLSAWAQNEFGVSFGPEQLARELRRDEISQEVLELFQAIPAGRRLRPPAS